MAQMLAPIMLKDFRADVEQAVLTILALEQRVGRYNVWEYPWIKVYHKLVQINSSEYALMISSPLKRVSRSSSVKYPRSIKIIAEQ